MPYGVNFSVFAKQIQKATTSLVFIIPQLNASHLTVAFLPYSKNKDVFIIPQLNASHLTVAFLPYGKNKDVFIITQFYLPNQQTKIMFSSYNYEKRSPPVNDYRLCRFLTVCAKLLVILVIISYDMHVCLYL